MLASFQQLQAAEAMASGRWTPVMTLPRIERSSHQVVMTLIGVQRQHTTIGTPSAEPACVGAGESWRQPRQPRNARKASSPTRHAPTRGVL